MNEEMESPVLDIKEDFNLMTPSKLFVQGGEISATLGANIYSAVTLILSEKPFFLEIKGETVLTYNGEDHRACDEINQILDELGQSLLYLEGKYSPDPEVIGHPK